MPLYQLLGGRSRHEVLVYGHVEAHLGTGRQLFEPQHQILHAFLQANVYQSYSAALLASASGAAERANRVAGAAVTRALNRRSVDEPEPPAPSPGRRPAWWRLDHPPAPVRAFHPLRRRLPRPPASLCPAWTPRPIASRSPSPPARACRRSRAQHHHATLSLSRRWSAASRRLSTLAASVRPDQLDASDLDFLTCWPPAPAGAGGDLALQGADALWAAFNCFLQAGDLRHQALRLGLHRAATWASSALRPSTQATAPRPGHASIRRTPLPIEPRW